jgi:hypothetical protein
VAFSKHEFRTSTQSDEDPPKMLSDTVSPVGALEGTRLADQITENEGALMPQNSEGLVVRSPCTYTISN